jgi:prepilin-type N-terminal cleavage/methylation domain-containing protein
MAMIRPRPGTRRNPQAGFTVVEVLIAAVILSVGLVALLGLFTAGITSVQNAQEQLIARQKAKETLEAIYSARNSNQVNFDMIQNSADGGIFTGGTQQLLESGADGIPGTADDGNVEEIVMPGPDQVLGTADDEHRSLTEFQREIAFRPLFRADGSFNADLRQIDVTVSYLTAGKRRSYNLSGYISRYR